MIRQYSSNTNESATMSISQKILELNKALEKKHSSGPSRKTKFRLNFMNFRNFGGGQNFQISKLKTLVGRQPVLHS